MLLFQQLLLTLLLYVSPHHGIADANKDGHDILEKKGHDGGLLATTPNDKDSLAIAYLRVKELAALSTTKTFSLKEKRQVLEELQLSASERLIDFEGVRDELSQLEGLQWMASLDDSFLVEALRSMSDIILLFKDMEAKEEQKRAEDIVSVHNVTRKRRHLKDNEDWAGANQKNDYHTLHRSLAAKKSKEFLNKNRSPVASRFYSRHLEIQQGLAGGNPPLSNAGPLREAHHSKRNLWELRRRLVGSTKETQCKLLVECVRGMSLFDYFVYIHSDDIDNTAGTVDENLIVFDEGDFIDEFAAIQVIANALASSINDAKCDSLLQKFHRTIEVGSVPQWQPATISQICLAEGTTTYVKLAELTKVFTAQLEHNKSNLMIYWGLFGVWKEWKKSPTTQFYACGANLRFYDDDGGDDQTAADGLRLKYCDLNNWSNSQKEVEVWGGTPNWGTWKGMKMCPANQFIAGAQVRYQDHQAGGGDDTALNGLKIYCAPKNTNTGGSWVEVFGGIWGVWKPAKTRTDENMLVTGARVQYEDNQGSGWGGGDDTAMNGLELKFETTANDFWGRHQSTVEKIVPIPFQCAEELFYSDDRLVNHKEEPFVFQGCSGSRPDNCPLTAYRFPVLDPNSGLRDVHGQLTTMQGAFGFTNLAGLETDLKSCQNEARQKLDKPDSDMSLDDLTKAYNECLQEKLYKPIDTSLELVFGSKPSIGFICGIKDAVRQYSKNDGKALPGHCCLDAPFQLDGQHWGYEYDCSSNSCKAYGPYFAGVSKDACLAQGGTYCKNPTDCSVLKTCIGELIAEAGSSKSFKLYLISAPDIVDSSDPTQCGNARKYFGFNENYIYDSGICMDIDQLKSTPDFRFLDTFFNQGWGDGSGGSEETPFAQVTMPPFVLEKIDRSSSTTDPVLAGEAWASTNFALGQALDTTSDIVDAIYGFECPEDLTGAVKTACAGTKNAAFFVFQIIFIVLRIFLDISENTRGIISEVNNIQPIEIWESTQALYKHMLSTGKYIQDGFDKLLEATHKIRVAQVGTRERLLLEGTKGKDGLTLDFDSDVMDSLVHYNEVRLNDVEAKLDKNNEVNLDKLNDVEAKLDKLNNDVEAKLDKISKDSDLYLAVEIVKKQTPTTLLVLTTLRGVPVDVDVEVMAYDANVGGESPVDFERRALGSGKAIITLKEVVEAGLVFVKAVHHGRENQDNQESSLSVENTSLLSLK